MKIAVTGGTGFVGRNLARDLVAQGHEVVLIARGRDLRDPRVRQLPRVTLVRASVGDERRLHDVFSGCDAVAHLAGIHEEGDGQDFASVHVRGTSRVVRAAGAAGVARIAMLSPWRAASESRFHASKSAAEEIVRRSGLAYTVMRVGVVYGSGDRLLTHLSRALERHPVFPLLGYARPMVRPVAVADVCAVLRAATTTGRLERTTVTAVGPEALCVSDVVRVVGAAVARRPIFLRVPDLVRGRRPTALERVMMLPARPLHAGAGDPEPTGVHDLPAELIPTGRFSVRAVRAALEAAAPFSGDRGRGLTAA